MARAGRLLNPLHRAGKSLGERLWRLRDECLNGEILYYSLKEPQIVIESWRFEYNTRRPHFALGYRPPAPLAIRPGENSTLNGANAI